MRLGMPISAVGHAAVLLWTLISFSKSFTDTPEESMPVDIISTKEFRQMMAGAQNAPKADKPKLVVDKVADPKPVEDPTPKVSPKPPIEATQSAPPPPPPSKAKPEEKDSKPPVDAIAEALKKDEAKRLEQKKLEEQKQAEEQKKLDEQKQAEEQKKLAEQKQAEEQKKLEEQKQAEEQKKLAEQKQAEEQKRLEEQRKAEEQKKLAEQKKAEEQKKLAEQKKAEEQKKREEARKRAEAKKIEDAKNKKLEERIANLLDTRDPRREAATGVVPNQTPNLGSPKGTAPTLSQTELDAMRARLMNNWHPDEAVFERPDQYVVVIRFSLGRDRMLSGPPQVVSAGSGPLSQATADAAKRAILVSQPFDMLSLSHYDEWNDLEITFNPRELRDH
jgi:colicin import membrane protein